MVNLTQKTNQEKAEPGSKPTAPTKPIEKLGTTTRGRFDMRHAPAWIATGWVLVATPWDAKLSRGVSDQFKNHPLISPKEGYGATTGSGS